MQLTSLKKTFTKSFLVAGLAASMVACKKDKDNGPAPGPNASKIETYKNGEDFIRFTYNAEGVVTKVTLKTDLNTGGDETDYTVTYNAQKKIEKLESTWDKIEVEYENNVMSRAKMFQFGQQTGYTNYHFSNGNLDRAALYFGESGTFIPLMEYNMEYNAQGNITETVVMMANGEPDHLERAASTEFEYDQKTNPLYAQRDILALFWQAVSKNNVTVETEFDADQQPEDKYVYTYTYKANGLPEKATVKQGLPGQEPVTSLITFSYK